MCTVASPSIAVRPDASGVHLRRIVLFASQVLIATALYLPWLKGFKARAASARYPTLILIVGQPFGSVCGMALSKSGYRPS